MSGELTLTPVQSDVRPNVSRHELVLAFALIALFVALSRLPFARPEPMETDEVGYIEMIAEHVLPMHHTLFLTSARLIGLVIGDPYRGFIILDMAMSVMALVSVWWWLRAVVQPNIAAGATFLLAVAPTFWAYGAMAGNYTAIIAVGSFLLGVVVRTWQDPRGWHPYAAAIVLAVGTGYRQDIGTFWTPILLLILWRHRWRSGILAGLLFVVVNLAWLVPMLIDVGGWEHYRAESKKFAHSAGYMNSVFYLGLVDATARYVVKLGLALAWTFGLALLVVPLGLWRMVKRSPGWIVPGAICLSILPPLAFHLTIHFGVPGYAFHYVPALMALVAFGVEGAKLAAPSTGMIRIASFSLLSAATFLFYTPDYANQGARGSFDLSVGRCSRVGVATRLPDRLPTVWRTANSLSVRKSADGRGVKASRVN